MQSVQLLRLSIQVVAMGIFMYQMLVAWEKFNRFTMYPTVETKRIQDALLPDVYLCLDDDDIEANLKKHGYSNKRGLYSGIITEGLTKSFLTWEGSNNVTYENITGIKMVFHNINWLLIHFLYIIL